MDQHSPQDDEFSYLTPQEIEQFNDFLRHCEQGQRASTPSQLDQLGDLLTYQNIALDTLVHDASPMIATSSTPRYEQSRSPFIITNIVHRVPDPFASNVVFEQLTQQQPSQEESNHNQATHYQQVQYQTAASAHIQKSLPIAPFPLVRTLLKNRTTCKEQEQQEKLPPTFRPGDTVHLTDISRNDPIGTPVWIVHSRDSQNPHQYIIYPIHIKLRVPVDRLVKTGHDLGTQVRLYRAVARSVKGIPKVEVVERDTGIITKRMVKEGRRAYRVESLVKMESGKKVVYDDVREEDMDPINAPLLGMKAD
ncbi:hypothetical protein H2198_000067 [Neophaeococcomyces mojaviensis]|uniref:Uncharacterized protein n=1 Tax=Neophaeococcomyces mojaviensis TaxID=3383035 RepID=A0ACC3AKU5_9EURO|nr:hypothetical protein H2198_000067 [Knufia sp. JES_112]